MANAKQNYVFGDHHQVCGGGTHVKIKYFSMPLQSLLYQKIESCLSKQCFVAVLCVAHPKCQLFAWFNMIFGYFCYWDVYNKAITYALSTKPREEAGWSILGFPAFLSHKENTSAAYRELTHVRVERPSPCPCVRGVHWPGEAWNQLCHSNCERAHPRLLHSSLVLWLIFKKPC